MDVLRFEVQTPPTGPALGRADVACFIGFAAPRCGPAELGARFARARERGRLGSLERRLGSLEQEQIDVPSLLALGELDGNLARALLELALPALTLEAFERAGWTAGGRPAPRFGRPLAELAFLRDVPVLVESPEAFSALFETGPRPSTGSAAHAPIPNRLAAAVRSYFAAGGVRAWIVALGETEDPAPAGPQDDADARSARIQDLLPGFPGRSSATGSDPRTWRGLGHLLGLEEVSFVALPDLVEWVALAPLPAPSRMPGPPERFAPCGTYAPDAAQEDLMRLPGAPRCDGRGLVLWARALNHVALFLRERAREMQLVAALPLVLAEADAPPDTAALLRDPLGADPDAAPFGIASAFVQLVHPWLRTRDSRGLPEGLEGGEGVLLGLLARSALARGSWRSVAGLVLPHVTGVERPLSRSELALSEPVRGARAQGELSLRERVVLVHRTPRGWSLASDVTTSGSEAHRHAGVGRLVASVLRAARLEGGVEAFEPSGRELWARVRNRLESLLDQFVVEGALEGSEPYRVRCDRTTMTQEDLDAGRTIAEIELQPTVGIERITVRLALRGSIQARAEVQAR